jgi:peptide deformylase
MTINDIRVYPDPVLRKVSEKVKRADESTDALIKDMFQIMEEAGGIGLAAPQIGVLKRIIAVSLKEKNFSRLALIDPVIECSSEETDYMEEGCLSIPGVNADVRRPLEVIVRGITRSGREVEITARNLLARVLQHEIDHLNGILFIDRLDDNEKKLIEKDLDDLCRNYSAITS